MALNITFVNPMPEITPVCVEWCQEAHFAHSTNLEVQGLFLLAFAFIALAAHTILRDHEHYEKYQNKLLDAAKFFIIGFFVYYWLNSRGLV